MKRFVVRVFCWWISISTPAPQDNGTLVQRERNRKAQLISVGIIGSFAFSSPLCLFYLLSYGLSVAFTIALCFEVMLALQWWCNRHGHLYTASLVYLFGYLGIVALGIYMSGHGPAPQPQWLLWQWLPLAFPSAIAGMVLPVWVPFFFTALEGTIIWGLYGLQTGSATPLSILTPTAVPQFALYVGITLMGMATIGAIYAYSINRAIIQADRASELEIAHQALAQTHEQLAQAHTMLEHQAMTDAITGLPNHRALIMFLEEAVVSAQDNRYPLAVIFFDGDRFKQVNDTYGHAVGDNVLRQLGERAASKMRMGDLLARYGGEEFVAVLPHTDNDTARYLAEQVREAIACAPLASADVAGGIACTVSVGLACYPQDGMSATEILAQADHAMYWAKHLGRNQLRTASEARSQSQKSSMLEQRVA